MYRDHSRCKHVDKCDEIHVQIERKMKLNGGHMLF